MFESPFPHPNTFPSGFRWLCRSQGGKRISRQTKDVSAGFRSLAVMITAALAVGIPLDQVFLCLARRAPASTSGPISHR